MEASKPPTIFFSAGEPSGDLHGANLIRQLQAAMPGIRAVGYGGPKMAEAGCRLHADLTALAVMWFARVLVNLHKFWDLASRADRYFRHHRPDAVVLIDYPGFNWWIARRAKAHGIPVFYYTPPQIWAWAQWRVKKMRRLGRPRAVQPAVRGAVVPPARLQRHVRRPSVLRRGPPLPLRRAVPRRAPRASQGRWWRSCPARGRRKSRTTCGGFSRRRRMVRQAGAGRAVRRRRVQAASGRDRPADGRREPGLPVEVYVGKTPELMRLADCAWRSPARSRWNCSTTPRRR